MLDTRIGKADSGWALYLGKKWVADFSSKTVALYFEKLLNSDPLLQHLVLECSHGW